MPIVDAHHHLHGTSGDIQFYRREDLARDLGTGHRVLGTVYVEAFESGWRHDGPEALRSLGEVEWITQVSVDPIDLGHGPCLLAAAVVSHVDLRLGEQAQEILAVHLEAGQGKLRGVRQQATFDDGEAGNHVFRAQPQLMSDDRFRRGFSFLARHGLSFDALVLHTQLDEVAAIADVFPDTNILLNHIGVPLGVSQYRDLTSLVFSQWRRGLRALAARPNVCVKIGGMGMPLMGFGFEHRPRPPSSQELARAWQPYINACIDAFGVHRCMFESNFPVDKQSCGYAEVWNAFKLATHALSSAERQALFYRTACRTYRMPELEAAADALMDE